MTHEPRNRKVTRTILGLALFLSGPVGLASHSALAATPATASPATASPATASPALTLLPAPGKSVTYASVFDGHFWNGEKESYQSDDTLKRDPNGIKLVSVDAKTKKSTTSTGTLDAQGMIISADTKAENHDPFESYNTVAALVAGSHKETAGSHWAAKLPVQTGPSSSDMTQVPVDVTIASATGDTVVLQASGTGSGTSKYGRYTSPISLTIQVATKFSAGQLQRADYTAKEFVNAGPFSQTMHWKWSLARE